MQQNTVLTIALIVIALTFLIQAAALIGIWMAMRKLPGRLEAIGNEVKQRLDPLAQSLTDVVSNAREPLRSIGANLADISKMLRQRTGDLDSLVADVLDKSRVQVARVDQLISDLVRRIETTSEVMERGVKVPIQEVSAVLKGMRAGLDFLLTRRNSPPASESAQDEQLFI